MSTPRIKFEMFMIVVTTLVILNLLTHKFILYIGLAASTLLVGNGDILGCSGIVSSIILNPREAITSKNRWKIVFVSTFLVTSTLLGSYFSDNALCGSLQESEAMQGYNISNFGYALAGFLVGFGSKVSY